MEKKFVSEAKGVLNELNKKQGTSISDFFYDQEGNKISVYTGRDIYIKSNPNGEALAYIQGASINNGTLDIRHAACAIELQGSHFYRVVMSFFISELASIQAFETVILDKDFLTNTSSRVRNKQYESIKKFCKKISLDAEIKEIDHVKKVVFSYKTITPDSINDFINASFKRMN
ncbi:hypothetical protein [Vibrio owensii]|uniref:hypothetical protein n=1 Tax=Vibrio owensii TaxID=696485 RepID=UPI00221E6937|nr:hypothetical protein [Vibrio owensii]